MKALIFSHFGDNSVLHYGDVADPTPAEDEVIVKTNYAGLNFADIYRRRGDYHIEPHNPFINGYEGLGEIANNNNHENLKIGQRVMFVDSPLAQAELVAVPVSKLIVVPDELSDVVAASVGLQGLTADFLANDLSLTKPGDNVFIQGIGGGVGQLLLQILKANGNNVFGVTSTNKKRINTIERGADKVFLREDNWDTKYQGFFDYVFDGVGTTFKQSLNLIKHRGKLVFFGMAAGNPDPINPLDLLSESKSILTGDLWDYLRTSEDRNLRFKRLTSYINKGKLKVANPEIFKLSDGVRAYDKLETGKNNGKILLKP